MIKKILLFSFATILMVSCEKESISKYSDNIVGRWQLISVDPDVDVSQCEYEGSIEFTSDHEIIDYDLCENLISYGLWTIQDNILSLTESSMSLEFDGEINNFERDTRPLPEIPDPSVCGTCELITEDSQGNKTYGTPLVFCGVDLTEKEEESPVTNNEGQQFLRQ